MFSGLGQNLTLLNYCSYRPIRVVRHHLGQTPVQFSLMPSTFLPSCFDWFTTLLVSPQTQTSNEKLGEGGRGGGGGKGGREGAGNEAATAVIKNWMVRGNQGMACRDGMRLYVVMDTGDGMRLCCHGYRRHNVPSMVKFVNCMGLTQWTEVAGIVRVGKTRLEINKIWL